MKSMAQHLLDSAKLKVIIESVDMNSHLKHLLFFFHLLILMVVYGKPKIMIYIQHSWFDLTGNFRLSSHYK